MVWSFGYFAMCVLCVKLASAWTCVSIQSKAIHEGVTWITQNCSKDDSSPPLLTINSLQVDLLRDDIRVVPAVAERSAEVQTIPEMGAQNDKFIAGINGGYFWRVDIDGFWRDNVCRGKTRDEAEHEASDENPNYGIGDGLVMIDGKKFSNNCNCSGYSRPAVLKLTGSESDIEVLHRGETVQDPTVKNSIAAGPNLVSYDSATGKSFIDIPEDDDNINKFVFEATTAVGVIRDVASPSLIMVTTDGSDSCLPGESYCGLISPDLASLMLEVFHCTVAMSMDQGGSTTMWIEGENPDRNGVVSRSDNKQPAETEGARKLANGLFIEVLA